MYQLPYAATGSFSSLILDYLEEKPHLKELYHRFPSLDAFSAQIEEKKIHFSKPQRELLTQALELQYEGLTPGAATVKNIASLTDPKTFTVTTGHQLNLFTGPLYFIYKIASTIKLTQMLQEKYPQHHFVPVYWMATEDHDFDEIHFFNVEEKKIAWNKNASGPVGRLSTSGLDAVYHVIDQELGLGTFAQELKNLFQEAYLQHQQLSEATRFLVNALFEPYGLVIVDGDDVLLKKSFVPYMKKELVEQISLPAIEKTYPILKEYTIQVNPRAINLFYIENGIRERIVETEGKYSVLQTDLVFKQKTILDLLENHPEKFSPNVVLRPLYQEVILPNLCYIGGGGELAYWLELKGVFNAFQVPFPMLLLRNSVLLVTEKQEQQRQKLQLTWEELFLTPDALSTLKVKQYNNKAFDFSNQLQFLEQQFEDLRKAALQTDPSFIGAVNAQEKKQMNGLKHLEKRWFKAEKRKHKEELDRMHQLQAALFPGNSLQERHQNFVVFYKQYGSSWIQELIKEINPLDQNFNIMVLK